MNLTKKREVRAKLELARKMDKIPAVNQEITQVHTSQEFLILSCAEHAMRNML